MADKSLIIIGAGVAGLVAGCYGQMNGYSTQIFEMDSKAGGLCTAWDRKGYTIDGCLQWFVGTSPQMTYHLFWEELGVLQGKQIINMDQLYRIEGQDGKTFVFYTDPDRLEKHMKELAPEDSAFIDEFTNAIRHLAGFDPLKEMDPYLDEFQKWAMMNLGEFTSRFQNPFLREVFESSLVARIGRYISYS